MKKRNLSPWHVIALTLAVSIGGCSDSKPASVTEGLDQSAIDAYKEKEKQIEMDAMKDMELGK
ncbi:hypothetical protein NHH03_17090 [Stieleria sp. TO1_6]|uniref:hypothetical protein n=1 Tax=Stieleria tagensis TaxID=2956795 RepID=UPI00209ABB28|nr:hypothetical protein [Stieleria tagensis]MCO8123465.1 hypothetical protein [Stieleria tagensis]